MFSGVKITHGIAKLPLLTSTRIDEVFVVQNEGVLILMNNNKNNGLVSEAYRERNVSNLKKMSQESTK